MTDPYKTLIVTILDRSGSMRPLVNATIEGFNSMLKDQKEAPGKALWTMVQFDDKYDVLTQEVPIELVRPLNTETFVPRGWTALYDALGRTIRDVGERLAKLKESQRPGKVIVTVFTDGAENASTKFKGSVVKDMIEHQRSKYNWEFVFVGSTEEAIRDAQLNLGFNITEQYAATAGGIKRASADHSRRLLSYRSIGSYAGGASLSQTIKRNNG